MLSYNILPIFKARGIDKPFSFLVKAGISPTVAHKIVDNQTRVLRLDHVEIICQHLHCTPNDLLLWTPDKKKVIPPAHPLTQLKPKEMMDDWQQTLRSIPLDKLSEISRILNDTSKD